MIRLVAWARRRLSEPPESGFTLVELLVASMLGLIISGVVLSTLLAAQRSANSTTAASDLNGEARGLLNRLSGDLRQATPVWTAGVETPAITAVQNPYPGGSAGRVTSITFDADFSGDGCIDSIQSDNCPTAANPTNALDPNNPEVETFCWDPTSVSPGGQTVVYLIAGPVTAGTCSPSAVGVPPQALLSGDVTDLQIFCDSNDYLYDADGNGVTTWQELDAHGPPIGNDNGALDGLELTRLNSIKIVLQVTESGHAQTYQTLISLRNVS